MLVSSVTSPQGWKILSLVSVPMLEMNIRTSVKNVILFALLAVIMSVVFSAVISILITRRIKAVSYTHLDVYKRQVWYRGWERARSGFGHHSAGLPIRRNPGEASGKLAHHCL